MPIYTYQCNVVDCQHIVEDLRPAKERERTEPCPQCAKGLLQHRLSVIAHTPALWGDTPKFGV